MNAVFYGTGLIVWIAAAAIACWVVLYSYAAALSYFCCAVYAVFKWDRWRLVKWHLLPLDFMMHWWSMVWNGIPGKISTKQFVWTGVFKCQFYIPTQQEQP